MAHGVTYFSCKCCMSVLLSPQCACTEADKRVTCFPAPGGEGSILVLPASRLMDVLLRRDANTACNDIESIPIIKASNLFLKLVYLRDFGFHFKLRVYAYSEKAAPYFPEDT